MSEYQNAVNATLSDEIKELTARVVALEKAVKILTTVGGWGM